MHLQNLSESRYFQSIVSPAIPVEPKYDPVGHDVQVEEPAMGANAGSKIRKNMTGTAQAT